MTRKHYIAAAKMLREQPLGKIPRQNIINFLSQMFADDNPNFDKVRFEDACKPEWDNPPATKRKPVSA